MPEFINPENILNSISIRSDMVASDFGCGSGGWTIPLAQKLEDGIVFAIDAQESQLSVLLGKAKMFGVENIRTILADVEEKFLGVPEQSCDLILMTDLLFQIDNKNVVFDNADKAIKKQGELLVVEWKLESAIGPQQGKIGEQEIKEIAKKHNFLFKKELPAGSYHFALLFVKE